MHAYVGQDFEHMAATGAQHPSGLGLVLEELGDCQAIAWQSHAEEIHGRGFQRFFDYDLHMLVFFQWIFLHWLRDMLIERILLIILFRFYLFFVWCHLQLDLKCSGVVYFDGPPVKLVLGRAPLLQGFAYAQSLSKAGLANAVIFPQDSSLKYVGFFAFDIHWTHFQNLHQFCTNRKVFAAVYWPIWIWASRDRSQLLGYPCIVCKFPLLSFCWYFRGGPKTKLIKGK